jgi:hypothetical protein
VPILLVLIMSGFLFRGTSVLREMYLPVFESLQWLVMG